MREIKLSDKNTIVWNMRQKKFFVVLILLSSQFSCAEQMSNTSELEQILTCQYFAKDEYGDAALFIDQLKRQGIVKPLKQMPRYHFEVVGDLKLFGLKPIYLGHAHGDFRGTFARFSEDIEIVIKNLKTNDIELKKHNSDSITAYIGSKNDRYQLIITTVPKKYAEKNNPSVPYSNKDTTLVQCVYQGP